MSITKRTTDDLIDRLSYQASPGIHTFGLAPCGHWGRGANTCANCIDAELLRRGLDVTTAELDYTYTRGERGIMRAEKPRWMEAKEQA